MPGLKHTALARSKSLSGLDLKSNYSFSNAMVHRVRKVIDLVPRFFSTVAGEAVAQAAKVCSGGVGIIVGWKYSTKSVRSSCRMQTF